MKTILDFLRKSFSEFPAENIDAAVDGKLLFEINNKIQNQIVPKVKNQKSKVSVGENQIWLVKQEYDDYLNQNISCNHPFIVITTPHLSEIENEEIIRINVVSPFIELASSEDEICLDPSIIGFPFIIEKWNDQPMLVELLDEYLGYYEPKRNVITHSEKLELVSEPISEYSSIANVELSSLQREFREIEISRAKFLNHSVLALLKFIESKQTKDAGVVVSLFNEIEFPLFYIGQQQRDANLALAARTGIDNEDKYLLYENKNIPFKIFIRKNEDGFIISVESTVKVELLSNSKYGITGISNKEKTVFANLKPGNYVLQAELIKQPIRIRLK